MSSSMEWDNQKIKAAGVKNAWPRLLLAGVYLQGQIRQAINRGNPAGDDPSAPGEPPKKVSGELFSSIAVVGPITDGSTLRVLVGTNVVYGPRLELGFYGVDSRGRNYRQAPRPFLVSTLHANAQILARIALTGKR